MDCTRSLAFRMMEGGVEMIVTWEHIGCIHGGMTSDVYRAKVPGGWLVQVQRFTSDNSAHMGGLCFYPDPNHEWSEANPEGEKKAA
ncbi:MAG TPA: hypothetical protein VGK34_01350 [Armatimonadota bacterium]